MVAAGTNLLFVLFDNEKFDCVSHFNCPACMHDSLKMTVDLWKILTLV